MEALRRAEEKLGRPPYINEIAAEWSSMIPMLAGFFIMVGLNDLFKNDEILADLMHNRFSLNPERQSTAAMTTEFELFSDRFVRLFPTYVLDYRCRIRPGPETQTANFDNLKSLLLCKDLSRNQELDWVSGKNLRFLDGSSMLGNQVCF